MSSKIFSLICAAISVAFLWPSEGAISGDGLPWVLGWAVVATLVATGKSSAAENSRGNWHFFPLLLLVAGFWVSTWHVFQVEGDRRAAVNLAFEWTGICLAGWCMRRIPSGYLHLLPSLIVAIGVGISVLGILQYHVANERQADWYRSQTSALESSASVSERQVVENEFQRLGIPLTAGRRELFERRLLDSSEPTGPFALANTFGGVLAVAFVFIFAGLLSALSSQEKVRFVSLLAVCLLLAAVGYCLILTKSRTAWAGCLVGVTCLFTGRLESSWAWARRVSAVVVVAMVAGLVGFASGAIDREVLLESPKSLQYRLFYWTGAARVIQESPLFGAGPGNFRQAYLAHKVPESSEEILDPHNVFFDAWCSAGLIGFVGMSWMTLMVVSTFRSFNRIPSRQVPAKLRLPSSLLIRGLVMGTFCYLGLQWFDGAPFLDLQQDFFRSRNLLLVVPVVAAPVVFVFSGPFAPPASSASAAFMSLNVHLLGAGGLQITVVGLLLAVCYSVASSANSNPSTEKELIPRPVFIAVFISIAAAVAWTGIRPSVLSRHHLEVASFRKAMGDKNAALSSLESAIAADALSVNSRQQNAEFLTYELSRNRGRYALNSSDGRVLSEFEKDFAKCADAVEDLIQSDRRRTQGYYLRSQLYRIREAQLPGTSLEHCLADLRHVVEIYPTNVQAWAELAILRQEAGVAQAEVARDTALNLDSINRAWGHVDRYLSDDVIVRLKAVDVR